MNPHVRWLVGRLVGWLIVLSVIISQNAGSNSFIDPIGARVADPDPVGSVVCAWIRIRFSNFSGSGFGSGFSPDSGTKNKIAERSLKVIYQKKT